MASEGGRCGNVLLLLIHLSLVAGVARPMAPMPPMPPMFGQAGVPSGDDFQGRFPLRMRLRSCCCTTPGGAAARRLRIDEKHPHMASVRFEQVLRSGVVSRFSAFQVIKLGDCFCCFLDTARLAKQWLCPRIERWRSIPTLKHCHAAHHLRRACSQRRHAFGPITSTAAASCDRGTR